MFYLGEKCVSGELTVHGGEAFCGLYILDVFGSFAECGRETCFEKTVQFFVPNMAEQKFCR